MDEEIKTQLLSIHEMTNSAGWGYLKRYFTLQAEALQDEINEIGNNELKYSIHDVKKQEMKLLKDILAFPERYIQMFINKPEEEDDPYKD